MQCRDCVWYEKPLHNKKHKDECFCNFFNKWIDNKESEDCGQYYDGCCDGEVGHMGWE